MKLTILQPVFIPNLADLGAILHSDTLLLDDLEIWSRKGRTHRALIRTPEGTAYITVPVVTEDKRKSIGEVRIDQSRDWTVPLMRSLEYNYRNSVYFDFYEPEIRADLELGREYEFLVPFSLHLRKRIFRFLELTGLPEMLLASETAAFDPDPDKTARTFGAKEYTQEHGARHYQRQGQGELKRTIQFNHPRYRQHFDGFEPYCCLLDLLFQYGPESFRITDRISETSGIDQKNERPA